jgi:hypothetical protein
MKRSVKTAIIIAWAAFCVLALSLIEGSLSLTPTPTGRWIITHVINPSDPASFGVLSYLKDRKATNQYDELIIFTQVADTELVKSFKKLGFAVEYKKESELHLEEAALKLPFFLLTSPRGEGVFSGPYDLPVQDLEIARSFFSNKSLPNFPMSGCGVTVRIQKRIDPQGTLASLLLDFNKH